MQLCQYVDCSAVCKKVEHHLSRHLTRVRTDAFGCYSVVRGKYVNGLLQRVGKIILSNRHHLRSEILEHAEAAWRFCQHIQMRTRACKPLLAGRHYARLYARDNQL